MESLQLANRTVFLRVDLNLPMQAGVIRDDSRLRAILPTLRYLLEHKAKVALASHLGRPKGVDAKYSLAVVAPALAAQLHTPVHFVDDCIGPKVAAAMAALPGAGVVLLENTRFHAGEEANDAAFSQALSQGFNVYINDAFGTMHRAHASTVGMVRFFQEKAMGLLVARELEALQPLLQRPQQPLVLILGGAKVSDKLALVKNFLPRLGSQGRLLIGGGMAFTFLKAQGIEIGRSLCDDKMLDEVKACLALAKQLGVQVVLPADFRVATADGAKVVQQLDRDAAAMDIGPQSEQHFAAAMQGAATVFWNGPLGVFENPHFMHGTLAVAKAVAALPAQKVIGGGDTLAAFAQLNLTDQVSHASTGGGATLEFLEGQTLPGLQALM